MDKIVLIEDDAGIRTVIRLALKGAGYSSICETGNGTDGLALVQRENPALVILDLMLPGMDGLAVCSAIRRTPSVSGTPIVMLTARSSEEDVVRGLELGADDYVTKPFSNAILVARVKAALRRTLPPQGPVRTLGPLVVDENARAACLDGAELSLTCSEFDLLDILSARPGRVYTRQQIIARIQREEKDVTDRTVDTLMVGLRRSAGNDLSNHADRAEFEAVCADGLPRSVVRESETLNISMFYFARRIGDYVLRIAVPYQAVTDAKTDAVRGLIAAVGTGALIVAALFFLARRYEQRLSRLSAERDLQDKMMAEMRKLERFRTNFISNVTHEIRTPVTGILGATEMLSDDAARLDDADRAELQSVIKSHSSRLVALVDDILALAGLEKAEAEHDAAFAPCNVADIAQTALNLARPAAVKAGISLSFVRKTHDAEALVRPCDARLVESAIANLVQNAVRHSGSKEVEVCVGRTADGKASVSVVDHGVGIPEDCQPRLFERFYRIDKNRSRTLGGTGLGLAIVKHIAQLHGGQATVSSRPGEGATFTLVI